MSLFEHAKADGVTPEGHKIFCFVEAPDFGHDLNLKGLKETQQHAAVSQKGVGSNGYKGSHLRV